MASLVEDIVAEAGEVTFDPNPPLVQRVIERDVEVDNEEIAVEQEVIRLMALYQPVGADLRLLCAVLKVNNDLERISDCAVNIAERAEHFELQPLANEFGQLKSMLPLVRRILRDAIQAYGMENAELATHVLKSDCQVDEAYAKIVRSIVANAHESVGQMAAYLDVLSVAKNLERIADHATNIAEDVIFLSTGSIVRHRGADVHPPDEDAAGS